MFTDFSGKINKEDTLTWQEVINTISKIKDELKNFSNYGTKYTSFKAYYDDTYKHIRKDTSPNQTFKSPITYGQGYGFYNFSDRNLNEIKYPKKKCEETKYAESIILSGNKFIK